MKFKILTLAVLTALIGVDAHAAVSPEFSQPLGYLNAFTLGVSGGKDAYDFGFAVPDIANMQAITTDDLTFELRPNVYEYTNALTLVGGIDTNAVATWTDSPDGGFTAGPNGNRWTELLTYYEINPIPPGTTNVTFTFTTGADTLDAALYKQLTLEPKGFVKVFTANFGGTFFEERQPLVSGNQVTISYDIPVDAWGLPLQVGYIMEGINANADTYGGITVTTDSLTITSGDGTPPAPAPDFINGTPEALSDSSIYMEWSESLDTAGVEYMARNVTLGYDSGWQAETNWTDLGPLGPITTNDVETIVEPDFAQLEPFWEGWTAPGGDVGSETFVTVDAGVATVTPANAGERSFYQTYGTDNIPALAPNQDYEFSFSADNITVNGSAAGFFVKKFTGGWGETIITKTPFVGGGATQTFQFTTDDTSVFYQVGWYTIGATTGSYDVQNPSLLALDIALPGPPQGLDPSTEYEYQVRARDGSALTNDTGWSASSFATTLSGDLDAPSPDPMEFAGPGDASSQSVLMTAVTATDASAVEYYFQAQTAGGTDSGWQDSTVYVDTGLAASSTFEYKVQARDKSAAQNATAFSITNISITTLSFPLSVSLTNDLKGFTPGTSNEDLTVHDVLKGDLQFANYANLPQRVKFDANGATFGSFASGDAGRNILKTLANNYAAADFEAYITSSFSSGDQNIFIGVGPGDLGAFGVPDWSPNGETTNASFIVQVLTNDVQVWSQEANFSGSYAVTTNQNVALNIGDDQRIKLAYDAGASNCVVSVDVNYDGVTFTPEVILTVDTPVFTGPSTIYLGGDDNVILSDFEIIGSAAPKIGVTDLVITPGLELQWTGVAGQLYDVSYKNNLVTDPSWTVDTNNDNIPGVDGAMSATPAVAGDEVFYQVIAK